MRRPSPPAVQQQKLAVLSTQQLRQNRELIRSINKPTHFAQKDIAKVLYSSDVFRSG